MACPVVTYRRSHPRCARKRCSAFRSAARDARAGGTAGRPCGPRTLPGAGMRAGAMRAMRAAGTVTRVWGGAGAAFIARFTAARYWACCMACAVMRVAGGLGAEAIARCAYTACAFCAEMRVRGGLGAEAIARRMSATYSAFSLLSIALRSRRVRTIGMLYVYMVITWTNIWQMSW